MTNVTSIWQTWTEPETREVRIPRYNTFGDTRDCCKHNFEEVPPSSRKGGTNRSGRWTSTRKCCITPMLCSTEGYTAFLWPRERGQPHRGGLSAQIARDIQCAGTSRRWEQRGCGVGADGKMLGVHTPIKNGCATEPRSNSRSAIVDSFYAKSACRVRNMAFSRRVCVLGCQHVGVERGVARESSGVGVLLHKIEDFSH